MLFVVHLSFLFARLFSRFQFILIHAHSRALALAMESKQKSPCIILNLFDGKRENKSRKYSKIMYTHKAHKQIYTQISSSSLLFIQLWHFWHGFSFFSPIFFAHSSTFYSHFILHHLRFFQIVLYMWPVRYLLLFVSTFCVRYHCTFVTFGDGRCWSNCQLFVLLLLWVVFPFWIISNV